MSINEADTKAYLGRLVRSLQGLIGSAHGTSVEISADGRCVLRQSGQIDEHLNIEQLAARLDFFNSNLGVPFAPGQTILGFPVVVGSFPEIKQGDIAFAPFTNEVAKEFLQASKDNRIDAQYKLRVEELLAAHKPVMAQQVARQIRNPVVREAMLHTVENYRPPVPEPEPVVEPTEEGKKRYSGGHYDEIPCTCTLDCPEHCEGKCGCRACWASYTDARYG